MTSLFTNFVYILPCLQDKRNEYNSFLLEIDCAITHGKSSLCFLELSHFRSAVGLDLASCVFVLYLRI